MKSPAERVMLRSQVVTILEKLIKSKASISDCQEAITNFNKQNNSEFRIRLRSANGQGLMGTCDVKWDRININVEDAEVINIGKNLIDYVGGKLVFYSFG